MTYIKTLLASISIVVFILLTLEGCVWPKRRYMSPAKDQTLQEFYTSKGIPISTIRREARLELDQIIEKGQKVFVPHEFKEQEMAKQQATSGTGGDMGNLIWPIQGASMSSGFGYRWNRFHEGVDLIAPIGTPIHGAASGEVIYSGNKIKGYGNMVVVKHSANIATVYAHNKINLVKKGQQIKKGQRIAELGNSGKSTGAHLHFEVRQGSKPIDPTLMLPKQKAKWADYVIK